MKIIAIYCYTKLWVSFIERDTAAEKSALRPQWRSICIACVGSVNNVYPKQVQYIFQEKGL